MTYQDKWGNGRVIEKGYRECAARYEIVRAFCERIFGRDGTFRVRDIGANMCYFGLRLTEDFPNCFVTAFENHHAAHKAAEKHLTGKPVNIFLSSLKMSCAMLPAFGPFDLTLAFSVLHHSPEPLGWWINGLQNTSKHTIIELAVEPSARNHKRAPVVPEGATILGYGDSHLEAAKRPIFYLEGK